MMSEEPGISNSGNLLIRILRDFDALERRIGLIG
jgi:hypothetical protein